MKFDRNNKHSVFLMLLLWVSLPGWGQQHTATIKFENIPLKQAMEYIETTFHVFFLYNSKLIDDSKLFSIDKKEASLTKVLEQMFRDSGIQYRIENGQVILFISDLSEVSSLPGNSGVPGKEKDQKSPPVTINGKVVDQENQPLPGAVLIVRNDRNKYTVTDSEGHFVLPGLEAGDIVEISFLGYEKKEIQSDKDTTLTIHLKVNTVKMEEVLVTGYQTLSRERASGAFNLVKNNVVEKRHVSDLSMALLGTTAGMQGKENADGTIEYMIRGMSTLTSGNSAPLVVVDGFPVSNGFQDINPNDVENITVLKDAAAASIWGARSANGVIVVTTKRMKGQGKINVEANAMVRVGSKPDLSTVLTTASSQDQVYFEKLAYENGWITPVDHSGMNIYFTSPFSEAKDYIYAYANGKIKQPEMEAALARLSGSNNRKQIKEHLFRHSILQQYNLRISGATARTSNYMSVMYEKNKANIIRNKNERWRVNFNNQTDVFKWLNVNVGLNLHYVQSNNSGPAISEMSDLLPYEMILDEEGNYVSQRKTGVNPQQRELLPEGILPYEDWTYNILREARGRNLTNDKLNVRLQAGLGIKLLPGLSFNSKFQYELNNTKNEQHYREETFFVRNMVNYYVDYDQAAQKINKQFIPKGGILMSGNSEERNYSWRNQLTFDKNVLDQHAINFIAGFEISQNGNSGKDYPYLFGYDEDRNFSAPLPYGAYSLGNVIQLKNIIGRSIDYIPRFPSVTDVSAADTRLYTPRKDRFVSVYANLAYTFKERYSLTASIRSDASNLITDKASYRWAPLWSVGGIWNLHQEDFMNSVHWIDRLGFRLTYGFNGNVDRSTSPYTLLSISQVPSVVTGQYTATISNYGNPTLRWERTRTVNIGIDFSLWAGLFTGSIDLYNKRSKDILGTIALPAFSGTTAQKMNNAEISNKGIELGWGINTRITSDIRFSTKVTYSYNKNKITNLYYPNNVAGRMAEGYPVEGYSYGAVWAYKYLGMKEGIPYVEGPDGAWIGLDDRALANNGIGLQFLKHMGPGIDPHTLGWQGNFSGYGFSLSFLVTGKFGGHFRAPSFSYYVTSTDKNVANFAIREVIEGSDRVPSWPLPNTAVSGMWHNYAEKLHTLVESSSFVKLKEITLEYSLLQSCVKRCGLGEVKVFGQIRDIGCLWTANRYGYDPEWLPGTLKPATNYALGVTINFK